MVKLKQDHVLCTRKKKLAQLRKQHNICFPNTFRRNAISDQLHIKYDNKSNEELKLLNITVSLAGRMMNRRIMGKASFVSLQDMGGIIQLYISNNSLLDSNNYTNFKKWDLGDIIGVSGKLFKTSTGSLSVFCSYIMLLTKSIRQLPEKFHGLIDQEQRFRQRYLDLLTNEETRNVFKIRSRIIAEIRSFLHKKDFIEVETPMMQTIPGGAMARPFITHHNTLDISLYLRIAPELYLKRLVIGGFEKIFEINRNFRNEGLSSSHNPEFTMMELYMAYVDYRDIIKLIEEMFHYIINIVFDTTKIKFRNQILDFSKPFIKMTMTEAICHYVNDINLIDLNNLSKMINFANSIGIKNLNNNLTLGNVQNALFEELVEKHLIQPTFITHYPVEISPLARCFDENKLLTERFELFIGGREIANGFSELNDPEEQAKRFFNQLNLNKCKETNLFYDEDYILALEYGLPPTAGFGIGIDRLIMILTNSCSIRDVIFFPLLRPLKKNLE